MTKCPSPIGIASGPKLATEPQNTKIPPLSIAQNCPSSASVGTTLPPIAAGPEGINGLRYPWGNLLDPARVTRGRNTPPPIGGRPGSESPWGARAMAGGVWEWTNDFWGEFYYREAPKRNPKGPPSGFLHTIKGGSYRNSPEMLRSATRFRLDAIIRWKIVGFRCARSIEP